MAESITARLTSLADVRASVQRMQAEGERLVTRIGQDARELVTAARKPTELIADARQRATKAVETLAGERARLRELLVQRLGELGVVFARRIGAASATEVEALAQRVAELERRLDAINKTAAA
jgi:hypothetical protein